MKKIHVFGLVTAKYSTGNPPSTKGVASFLVFSCFSTRNKIQLCKFDFEMTAILLCMIMRVFVRNLNLVEAILDISALFLELRRVVSVRKILAKA